jgi:hypothetical protein
MQFSSFAEFYPFYLSQHRNGTCRQLHVVGTTLLLVHTVYCAVTQQPMLLLALPLIGYGFAWVGHFVFEKNRPATFKAPLYSLWGDFVMWKDTLTGRLPWRGELPE